MFSPDVVTLRQFYATPFGESVRALIAAALHTLWSEARGDAVLGIGYCPPYLESYLEEGAPVMACMPAQQGAAYWPASRLNRVFLAAESDLPLRDNSINRILLLHSIEHSDHLPWMMEEIWRVLTPGGRVLAIVPNRLSFWSHSAKSPLGYGRPFSMAQLRDLMTSHQFTLTRSGSALFIPPLRWPLLWRGARHIEKIGRWLCPFLGGVLLLEAEKQIYAATRQPVFARKGYKLPMPASEPVLGRFTAKSR
jgi:SAM-dependent methyltransferase